MDNPGAVDMNLEPTPEERAMLEAIAQRTCAIVRTMGATAIIGGSLAKDTWLSGSRDIDVFARFDVRSEEELNERVPCLFEAFPDAEAVRGSRTYLRFETDGVMVEVIPIRPLGEDANTMDHSPDHIAYVRDHLTEPNEVRMLKTLLRANRIYGAESHVRGFSGYVCELLIIAHTTLNELASAAKDWEIGARVPLAQSKKTFDDPLVVEDPTDPERNAAAAVDEHSFTTFTTLMGRIARGEAIETLLEPRAIEPPYASVTMYAAHEKPDVGFAQLRGIHDRLERELEPFGVRDVQWQTHEAWESRFVLERTELEPITIRVGPPVRLTSAAASFKEHHPDAYEEDGRLHARIERTETRWEEVVERICTHEHVASFHAEYVR